MPLTPYLPNDTEAVSAATLHDWVGCPVYIDLGDSVLGGGEFSALLVSADQNSLVVQHTDKTCERLRYERIVHIQPN